MDKTQGNPQQTELASPLILAQTDAMADIEADVEVDAGASAHSRLGSFSELSAEQRILLA